MSHKIQMLISDHSVTFQKALQVQKALTGGGFTAWFAGGCVRDALLGRRAADYDLVTNASVQAVAKLFPHTVLVGEQFGVLRVIFEGEEFEIAQFRKESDYQDGRRPNLVESATPEEDAHRRDLTVNALFYDPTERAVYDYVGGLADIKSQTLRAVGDPLVRFQEDHLRIMRAFRFRSQLGFQWSPDLILAIQAKVHLLSKVSRERVRDEYLKLRRGDAFELVKKSLVDFGLLKTLFPTLQFDPAQFDVVPSQLEEAVWWELSLWAFLSGSSWQSSVDEIVGLKLSKQEQRSLVQFLSWFEPSLKWTKESLGSLIERSFAIGARDGLVAWLEKNHGLLSHEQRLREGLRRHSLPPAPWIRAQDLPDLKGPELGAELKALYHRQLEGLDAGAEDCLQAWRQRKDQTR
ncbi:MAG: CCA tRNA nucleotidyltransferase [Bdellovibrio sp.]